MQLKDTSLIFRRPFRMELGAVSDLFKQIITSSFPMFTQDMQNAYCANWSITEIALRLQNTDNFILTAWHESLPVGLIHGGKPEGGVATVIWLLVAPEYRNASIGARLLKEARSYYQQLGCHKLKLTVPSSHARHFYEKNGMTTEGYHPNHWWNCDFWSLAMVIT